MRKIFISILVLFLYNNVNAQVNKFQENNISDTSKIIKVSSQFPGGEKAWARYLELHLDNNIGIKNGAPAGLYLVIVSFFVEKNGSISGINVEDDPGYGMGKEAIRIIEEGPKWIPARINGEIVIDRHRQAIAFKIFDFTNRN